MKDKENISSPPPKPTYICAGGSFQCISISKRNYGFPIQHPVKCTIQRSRPCSFLLQWPLCNAHKTHTHPRTIISELQFKPVLPLLYLYPFHLSPQCTTATVTTKTPFHFYFPTASPHTKLLGTVLTSAAILAQVDSTLCPNHLSVLRSLCFWCYIHSGMPAVPLHILYTQKLTNFTHILHLKS